MSVRVVRIIARLNIGGPAKHVTRKPDDTIAVSIEKPLIGVLVPAAGAGDPGVLVPLVRAIADVRHYLHAIRAPTDRLSHKFSSRRY